MKPPVEHVRVSAKGREILIKIKRRTGLEHWNEICRIALCQSLSNQSPPPIANKTGESTIDMDWKTFSGTLSDYIISIIIYRAKKDGVNLLSKDEMSNYFRSHLERGIMSIQNMNGLHSLIS